MVLGSFRGLDSESKWPASFPSGPMLHRNAPYALVHVTASHFWRPAFLAQQLVPKYNWLKLNRCLETMKSLVHFATQFLAIRAVAIIISILIYYDMLVHIEIPGKAYNDIYNQGSIHYIIPYNHPVFLFFRCSCTASMVHTATNFCASKYLTKSRNPNPKETDALGAIHFRSKHMYVHLWNL